MTLEIIRDEKGLALVNGKTMVRGDFSRLLPRVKPGNLSRELVVRASKVKQGRSAPLTQRSCSAPLAIDATAGLGEDAFLLAAAGFRVCMYEHNPTIAVLLRDTLERAIATPELASIVSRMQLIEGDSAEALRNMGRTIGNAMEERPQAERAQAGCPQAGHFPFNHSLENSAPSTIVERPDIVLLDPMFPAANNRAAAKKKLQLLQQLEDLCEDEEALLLAAMAAHPRKIIVKRPVKGPYLAGRKPSYSLTGKAIRFDCIILPRP